jgi:hypothetical protein
LRPSRAGARSGYAYPSGKQIFEYPEIALRDVIKLYQRDTACKASVDLLAMAAVGMGFYTTFNTEYYRGKKAKQRIDDFNEQVNLDGLLLDGTRYLVACGNDFWLKITPVRLEDFLRLPVESIKAIERRPLDKDGLKIPYRVVGYTLDYKYSQRKAGEISQLKPEAVIHFKLNPVEGSAFGTGILQVLLYRLTVYGWTRPAYAEAKAKIEKIIPDIFEKYAGPDVLCLIEGAREEEIKKFERAIKSRPPEGAWLFYTRKGDIKPVQLDPRARFEYYVDHIINQIYLGCETPLPRLFSTPGFTEASSRAALDLQDMLVRPIQRYVKRLIEREIFAPVLQQAGFDAAKAQVRLNWGTPEVPEPQMADMLKAAELGLIRPEEFRKNAAKFGWELWEKPEQPSRFSHGEEEVSEPE